MNASKSGYVGLGHQDSHGRKKGGMRHSTLGELVRGSKRLGSGSLKVKSPTGRRMRETGVKVNGDGAKAGRDFDPLALLRGMEVRVKGRTWVRFGSGKMTPWEHSWCEIRGNMLLFREIDEVLKSLEAGSEGEARFTRVACVSGADVMKKRKWGQEEYVRLKRGDVSVSLKFDSQELLNTFLQVAKEIAAKSIPTLADFKVIAPIGAGAAGRVFVVEDRRTGERLALKCVDKHAAVYDSDSSYRHAIDERLLLEMLGGEAPYTCQLRCAFQSLNVLYYAFPFYDGGDLFHYLFNMKMELTEYEAKYVLAQVVLALEAIHDLGFVYRDLKPENILLERDGSVRLCDFGLTKRLKGGAQRGRTTSVCGTHAYVAPEMMFDGVYGVSVDYWTLGIFLYHILCGRTPFRASNLVEVEMNLQRGFAWGSEEISREARSLILGLLSRDAGKRLGSDRGFEELKSHHFFQGVDWSALKNRMIPTDALLTRKKESEKTEVQSDFGQLMRNFDLNEWRGLDLLEDDDPLQLSDSSLWPPMDPKKTSLMKHLLVGFGTAGV